MHMVACRASRGMQACRSSWGIAALFTLHEKLCDQPADRMQPLQSQLSVPPTAAADAYVAVRLCWLSPASCMHGMQLVHDAFGDAPWGLLCHGCAAPAGSQSLHRAQRSAPQPHHPGLWADP